jgi:hypothetical protein
MYRVKKYQYVFYKHFLLHGLNVSIAIWPINITNEKRLVEIILLIFINFEYNIDY